MAVSTPAGRKLAMIVSTKSPICTLAEPRVAAPKARRNSFICALQRGQAQRESRSRRRPDDEEELQEASEQHAPGRRVAGVCEIPREQQRADHREVEKDRPRRRRCELLM